MENDASIRGGDKAYAGSGGYSRLNQGSSMQHDDSVENSTECTATIGNSIDEDGEHGVEVEGSFASKDNGPIEKEVSHKKVSKIGGLKGTRRRLLAIIAAVALLAGALVAVVVVVVVPNGSSGSSSTTSRTQPDLPVTPSPSLSMSPTLTLFPSVTPSISLVPTIAPTASPSSGPSLRPTASPSSQPTMSQEPSVTPSRAPSLEPSISSPPTGTPSSSPSSEPSETPTIAPSAEPSISSKPTAAPSSSPSLEPSLSSPPTQFPTATPSVSPTSAPSASPTLEPSVSFQPTEFPTVSPSASPTSSPTTSPTGQPSTPSPTSAPSTPSPTSAPSTSSPTSEPSRSPAPTRTPFDPNLEFRLRLHWEDGHMWQESSKERTYCMECCKCEEIYFEQWPDCRSASCSDNKQLWLQKCYSNGDGGVSFNGVQVGDSMHVKIDNRDLCITRRNKLVVTLEPCNINDYRQLWKPISARGKFELTPAQPGRYDDEPFCATQYHHPKPGEMVGMQRCSVAHRDETGYWIAY